jgi:hypothetical protein
MKRSNLFLALTTGALAIASFAFAKSNRGQGKFNTGWCANTQAPNLCTIKTANAAQLFNLTTTVGAKKHCINGNTAHSQSNAGPCISKTLYTVLPG